MAAVQRDWAAVQTALRALSNIGATGVTCSGGALPGTDVVITFGGTLAYTDVSLIVAELRDWVQDRDDNAGRHGVERDSKAVPDRAGRLGDSDVNRSGQTTGPLILMGRRLRCPRRWWYAVEHRWVR